MFFVNADLFFEKYQVIGENVFLLWYLKSADIWDLT